MTNNHLLTKTSKLQNLDHVGSCVDQDSSRVDFPISQVTNVISNEGVDKVRDLINWRQFLSDPDVTDMIDETNPDVPAKCFESIIKNLDNLASSEASIVETDKASLTKVKPENMQISFSDFMAKFCPNLYSALEIAMKKNMKKTVRSWLKDKLSFEDYEGCLSKDRQFKIPVCVAEDLSHFLSKS